MGRIARNVPLPEPHLALLGAGIALQRLRPIRLGGRPSRLRAFVGMMLIGSGLVVIAGSVATVGVLDLERPDRVVRTGPYALTRHPMYEAWTSIYGGIALVTRNGWLAVLLPLLIGVVHREAVGEERRLRGQLGRAYDEYARGVPRYVWMRRFRRSLPAAPPAPATARCR